MNRFIVTLCMAIGVVLSHAQNSKKNQEEFDAFRTEMHRDFDSFRARIMREYIEFVKNPWTEFESVEPIPQPKEEPMPPVVVPRDDRDSTKIKDKPILIENVIKPDTISPQPKPIEEIPEYENDEYNYVSISFYGIPINIRFDNNKEYRVKSVSEKNVAKALDVLATKRFDNCIYDCLKAREEYNLCDWAYLQLVQQVTDKACGKATNEATLLSAYILIQSGYKIRIALSGDRLYALYASRHCIFNKTSYSIDGDNYYCLEELPARLMISSASFPKEQGISLLISKQPKLSIDLSEQRLIASKAFPSFKVEVKTNKNLLCFYDTYPCSYYGDNHMTQWAQYANTPMDTQVVQSVYPAFKKRFEGLSEKEKVSRLLDWVQTGFTYEYDDKVWGRDRTFFSEETLFYPYCDCEDRSVLLTRLVRDLIGLDCILVYYPGHLATAVNFTEPVSGDYIYLNGEKFIICDPTYIGAPIGKTMPGMDNKTANVILLNE